MKKFWEGIVKFLNTLKDAATVDQYMGLLRQAIPAIGGLMLALGWITQDQLGEFTTKFMAIAGPLLLTVGAIWAVIANSQWSIRKAASKLPENKKE